MNIGDKIAKARKAQNLTQEQLADVLGVTRQAVSRWESDLAYPETEKLVALSKVLEINCDYLLKDGVTESGEKIVQVEVFRQEAGLFNKTNWRFIIALAAIAAGLYVGGFSLFFVIMNWNSVVKGDALLIALMCAVIAVSLTLFASGAAVLFKCFKKKEFFIKKEYKKK